MTKEKMILNKKFKVYTNKYYRPKPLEQVFKILKYQENSFKIIIKQSKNILSETN